MYIRPEEAQIPIKLIKWGALEPRVGEGVTKVELIDTVSSIGVRTVDGSAIAMKDFYQFDQVLNFATNLNSSIDKTVFIQILDQDRMAKIESREFTVQLYDPNNPDSYPSNKS